MVAAISRIPAMNVLLELDNQSAELSRLTWRASTAGSDTQVDAAARALVVAEPAPDLVPWDGAFRALRATCTLSANNDYEAVQAGSLRPPLGHRRRQDRPCVFRLRSGRTTATSATPAELDIKELYELFWRRPIDPRILTPIPRPENGELLDRGGSLTECTSSAVSWLKA